MIKQISTAYFPTGIKFCAPLLVIGGVYLITTGHEIWGVLLVILSAVILTTKYVTEIDLKERSYRDFLFLLGLNLNEESSRFNAIERVVITKGRFSQTINTRAQSRQMDWTDFTATLLLDNGTLDLLTRNSKKELLLALKEFIIFLNVPVEDRTSAQFTEIDIARVT